MASRPNAADLGTHLLSLGLNSSSPTWLRDVQIQDIGVLCKNIFQAVAECRWQGTSCLAVLEFPAPKFRELMHLEPPSVRERLRASVLGRTCPIALQLPAPRTLCSVECTFGTAVQTGRVPFTPLVVQNFTAKLQDEAFA